MVDNCSAKEACLVLASSSIAITCACCVCVRVLKYVCINMDNCSAKEGLCLLYVSVGIKRHQDKYTQMTRTDEGLCLLYVSVTIIDA